jgi:hypothetical protein
MLRSTLVKKDDLVIPTIFMLTCLMTSAHAAPSPSSPWDVKLCTFPVYGAWPTQPQATRSSGTPPMNWSCGVGAQISIGTSTACSDMGGIGCCGWTYNQNKPAYRPNSNCGNSTSSTYGWVMSAQSLTNNVCTCTQK